jgi:glycine/D-amino acid oxidase-like deaminating enzyme
MPITRPSPGQKPALRSGTTPIWLVGKRAAATYGRATGEHRVDAVVVGGGMTGALVAEAFARAGISVIVLEAGLVGRGSTAASSALLLREPDRGLVELTERYGERNARRIWQLSAEAVDHFIDRLHQLRIVCDLVRRDVVHYAALDGNVQRLAREFQQRRTLGFAGRWLSAGATRDATAVPARGAIRTSGHAQFDPYKACVGLLGAAIASGAQVFERSPVSRIRSDGNAVRVYTSHATVDARRVIVATGYATPRFRPLVGRFSMYRTFVMVTKPLTAAQRREVGLGEVMMWDTARPYHYARWTPDHRLLLGGGDRRVGRGFRRDRQFRSATQQLRDDFEAVLPGLSGIAIDAAWDGLFAQTPDSLPYIGPHRRYPSHLFALGYGGNGMTFGFLAARLLLEYWRGIRSPDQRLFAFGRMRSG